MKVLYNRYDKLDEVAAGASFYYYELSRLLSSQKDEEIEFIPFDFREVFSTQVLSKLTKDDVVIPNIGPYSWVFYYLREKNRLKFRIIHDVQTALFADHLLQEQLCENFIRDDDRVLFLSNYQRQLYMHLFPDSLNEDNTFVCNPLLNFLPKPKAKKENAPLTLGWVGRVFDAKNFDQALQIFAKTYKEKGGDAAMVVGGMADSKYQPQNVKRILKKKGVNPESYTHINEGRFVSHDKSLELLQKIDVLLFPSVANMESFGRVIVEANHVKTKVSAAYHGATPELLPEKNLVGVEYNYNNYIDLNTNQPMGRILVDDAVDSLLNLKKLSVGDNSFYKDHDEKLKRIIVGEQEKERGELDNKVRKFIKNVNIILNADYNLRKESALKKAMFATKDNLSKGFDIVKTSLALRQALNYKPSLVLKE